MNLKRAFAIFLRQFYLMRGNPSRFVTIFVWVVVDIVIWGFMTRYLNGLNHAGFDFVPAILGAVLLWDFQTRIMHGITMACMEDSWSRNFLNIFASPVTVWEYLLGLIASSISTSMIGMAVMLLLASGFFGLNLFAYGAMALPFLFILFLSGIALGIFATGLMLRFGPAAEWLIWPMPALIAPFAGVFYPLTVLPHWMQVVAQGLPPAYVFEGIRAISSGGTAALPPLLGGLALAVLYTALAGLFFSRMHRHVVRSGQLARYSAETG